MNEKKVFCTECRNDVNYTIIEEKIEGTIKGEEYSYIGEVAYCSDCGSEIYVPEINDFNLKALYDVYRERKNIISLDLILEIPKKYKIGKRPFSLLLGWGEQTFSRYCQGDMPTKIYSEILKKIYDEPLYYLEILERNRENLKTDASYNKSKIAVNEILGRIEFTKTKIDLAIGYLLNQCEDITPLALQKSLYYIQGFYYAFYQTFLFSDDCEAWVHGPVYHNIYLRYRDYQFDPIEGSDEFDDSVFSSSEKAILDSVIKNVSCYSGKVLERFTHLESPWLLARRELPTTMSSNRIIKKSQIGDYFCSIKEKYNMLSPNDIKIYTKIMFEQI
jgi:putative zinc finger/helix-turn-helix YgiT family protein